MLIIMRYGFGNSGNLIYKLNHFIDFASKYILLSLMAAITEPYLEQSIKRICKGGIRREDICQFLKGTKDYCCGMKKKIKNLWQEWNSGGEIYYYIVGLLVVVCIFFFLGFKKDVWFCDEVYSYTSANENGIKQNIFSYENEWIKGEAVTAYYRHHGIPNPHSRRRTRHNSNAHQLLHRKRLPGLCGRRRRKRPEAGGARTGHHPAGHQHAWHGRPGGHRADPRPGGLPHPVPHGPNRGHGQGAGLRGGRGRLHREALLPGGAGGQGQTYLRREERHRGETAVKFSGDLTIDFAGRRLSCQGSPIALTKKEFDIIAASFCAVT